MSDCSKASNFIEASKAKKKLDEFKKIENWKVIDELNINFNINKHNLDSQHKIDLNILNEFHDKLFADFILNIKTQEKNYKEKHSLQIIELRKEIEKTISEIPKPRSQIVNRKKILEKALKLKKFKIILILNNISAIQTNIIWNTI